ncbi:hypothetical protein F5884DRAFT_837872 [Xylogone sp. PMI_703]|nr:hypothetical protein F5884DRAFT_837872 [Xylogone sp. PMI_703]
MRFFNAYFVFLLSATLLLLQQVTAFPLLTSELATRANGGLSKRGCISSGDTGDLPLCDTWTVEALVQNINTYNVLPQKDCLFYLGLGGGQGQVLASQWYCSERPSGRGPVVWSTSLDSEFMLTQRTYLKSLSNLAVPDPANTSDTQSPFWVWAALHSQAMGETCNGDVYFFTPKSNPGDDPSDNIWWNYEHPALTRNPNVQTILKIDPTLRSDNGSFTDPGTLIWSQGDGPSAIEPAGTGYSFTVPAAS